ncbi:MAG: hypothetical protein LBC88_03210 [Spirochaetaceae bacterium]|jgi:hypothetical protein|nr:hypothetical protein [Spirochaetaceae bacterium]
MVKVPPSTGTKPGAGNGDAGNGDAGNGDAARQYRLQKGKESKQECLFHRVFSLLLLCFTA